MLRKLQMAAAWRCPVATAMGTSLTLPSTSSSLPLASSSCLRRLGKKTSRVPGQASPDSGGQRIPAPDGRPPRGPHPVRLQLFPLAQAAEEGLLLPAQRLPGGQEHRAPHVEPHPLAPAARRAAAHPRRRRCLPGLHPPGSPRRLHPPGAAAGGGQVPRDGHAGSCSPRPGAGRPGWRGGGGGPPGSRAALPARPTARFVGGPQTRLLEEALWPSHGVWGRSGSRSLGQQ